MNWIRNLPFPVKPSAITIVMIAPVLLLGFFFFSAKSAEIHLGETELMVFEGHRVAGDPAPEPAAEMVERPSAGARRLNKKASSGIARGSFRRSRD